MGAGEPAGEQSGGSKRRPARAFRPSSRTPPVPRRRNGPFSPESSPDRPGSSWWRGRAGAGWCGWGSCGGSGRGCVRICCKGAPGWDRPREEARNTNDSLRAPRLDPGLCNRFGQPVPPRIPGRGAAGRTATTAGAPGAETCTSHSRVQFQPLFSKAKRTSRGQNAHLDEEGAGRGCRGPRRRSRPGASPVREIHCDS